MSQSQLDDGWQGVLSARLSYRKGLVRDAKPCPTYSEVAAFIVLLLLTG